MSLQPILRRTACLGLAGFLLLAGAAQADEVRVVSSGGFAAAYRTLTPEFERQTGHKLVTDWGPSMGTTTNAVPQRLARNEPIDVVIMVGYALGTLVQQGKVVPDSRVDLARSLIGAAVRQGAPHPDISSVDALRQALLNAKSVAYSDSASGVYIQNEMFKRMGIAEQMQGKARMIPADPVGEMVGRGEVELGFQQISELKPIHGIDLLGPIPADVQQATVFSAGVIASSQHQEAARALIRFLASPAAAAAIRESGLEPMGAASSR
jgi:molybdate transport system substrate-binding protein